MTESASSLDPEFSNDAVALIEVVAEEAIDAMTRIEAAALEKRGQRSVGLDLAMGSVNSWTDAGAVKNLANAQGEQARAAHELALENHVALVANSYRAEFKSA